MSIVQFKKNIGVLTIIKTSAIIISTVGLIGLEAIDKKAQAASITQTINFNENIPISGDFDGDLLPSGYFSGTVSPFDSSLGTLNSFTVDWDIDSQLNATAGAGGGSAFMGLGGSFFLDESSYGGTGTGGGNGTGPNGNISFDIGITGSRTFLVSDAGVTYNPAILSAVIGSSDFDLLYDSALSGEFSSIESGTVAVTGSSTLTYDFEAATTSVPESSSSIGLLAIGGIFGLSYLKKRAAARQLKS